MKKKKMPMVNLEIDPQKPAPLTDGQKEELKALEALPDESIDYSDILPLDEKLLKKAFRGGMYRPRKTQMTLRLDMDVIAWQKSKGKGYQSRINKILRQAMLKELSAHVKSIPG